MEHKDYFFKRKRKKNTINEKKVKSPNIKQKKKILKREKRTKTIKKWKKNQGWSSVQAISSSC